MSNEPKDLTAAAQVGSRRVLYENDESAAAAQVSDHIVGVTDMIRAAAPTQAQIEATAKIVCSVLYRPAPDMSGDIWKAIGPGMKRRCIRAAEDILNDLNDLTAAAQVGEQRRGLVADLITSAMEHDFPAQVVGAGIGGPTAEQFRNIVNATIERCAQVVDEIIKNWQAEVPQLPDAKLVLRLLTALAAKIRKLKDE